MKGDELLLVAAALLVAVGDSFVSVMFAFLLIVRFVQREVRRFVMEAERKMDGVECQVALDSMLRRAVPFSLFVSVEDGGVIGFVRSIRGCIEYDIATEVKGQR